MMANHATPTRPRRRQSDEVHEVQYAPDALHDAVPVVQVPYPCTVAAAAVLTTVNHAEAAVTGQSRCLTVQDPPRASRDLPPLVLMLVVLAVHYELPPPVAF